MGVQHRILALVVNIESEILNAFNYYHVVLRTIFFFDNSHYIY